MKSKQLVSFLLGLFLLAFLAGGIWWRTRKTPANGDLGTSVPTDRKPVLSNVPIPASSAERAIVDRANRKLPGEEPLRHAIKMRMDDNTTADLIRQVGNLWYQPIMNVVDKPTDAEWLMLTFQENICVLRLVEEGRSDPEAIGSLISKDLAERAIAWPETCKAYESLSPRDRREGYGEAIDGTTDAPESSASKILRKFSEDRYAIPAEIFILMNIDYSDPALLAKFHPFAHEASKLDWGFLGASAAIEIQKNKDPRFDEAKRIVAGRLQQYGGMMAHEILVLTPKAKWGSAHPLVAGGVVDLSQEPRMRLIHPNPGMFLRKEVESMNRDLVSRFPTGAAYVGRREI